MTDKPRACLHSKPEISLQSILPVLSPDFPNPFVIVFDHVYQLTDPITLNLFDQRLFSLGIMINSCPRQRKFWSRSNGVAIPSKKIILCKPQHVFNLADMRLT